MTKRARRRVVIVLAIIALPVAFVAWQYITLRSYLAFIHRHYATEIEQLEAAMQQWPEYRAKDEATYQRVETLQEELRQTFKSGDFHSASWSHDSHHGLKSTGMPDSGSERYWLTATDKFGQSLCFGRSFNGHPLLVYQRWLPNAPVMKHIEIVLYRDKVDKSMKAKKAN